LLFLGRKPRGEWSRRRHSGSGRGLLLEISPRRLSDFLELRMLGSLGVGRCTDLQNLRIFEVGETLLPAAWPENIGSRRMPTLVSQNLTLSPIARARGCRPQVSISDWWARHICTKKDKSGDYMGDCPTEGIALPPILHCCRDLPAPAGTPPHRKPGTGALSWVKTLQSWVSRKYEDGLTNGHLRLCDSFIVRRLGTPSSGTAPASVIVSLTQVELG